MRLSAMEKREIEKKVQELLIDYGYYQDEQDAFDVVRFARSHGFFVGAGNMPDSEDGFLIMQPDSAGTVRDNGYGEKVIVVNKDRPAPYNRFVIAHEFAHSVLHYKGQKIYLHREHRKGKGEMENDADYFAAALLMPEESFRRSYQKLRDEGLEGDGVSARLAQLYRVPLESARRRIEELELAS